MGGKLTILAHVKNSSRFVGELGGCKPGSHYVDQNALDPNSDPKLTTIGVVLDPILDLGFPLLKNLTCPSF